MIIFKHKINIAKSEEEKIMKKEMKEKMELINNLKKLELEIMNYKWRLKDESDPDMKAAIQKDIEMDEYTYKRMTVELTTEDREELYKIALENDVKLECIKKFVFTEEEKEEWYELEEIINTPSPKFPGWDEELARLEEKMKRVNKEAKRRNRWWRKPGA